MPLLQDYRRGLLRRRFQQWQFEGDRHLRQARREAEVEIYRQFPKKGRLGFLMHQWARRRLRAQGADRPGYLQQHLRLRHHQSRCYGLKEVDRVLQEGHPPRGVPLQ